MQGGGCTISIELRQRKGPQSGEISPPDLCIDTSPTLQSGMHNGLSAINRLEIGERWSLRVEIGVDFLRNIVVTIKKKERIKTKKSTPRSPLDQAGGERD